MKNKLYLTESEKKEILEQHISYKNSILGAKNIINEQELKGEEIIKKAIELGCNMVVGSKVGATKSGRVYRKEVDDTLLNSITVKSPSFKKGDLLDFSIPTDINNLTFTIISRTNGQIDRDANGKIIRKGPEKWKCEKLLDFINAPAKASSEEWIKSGNWTPKRDAITSGLIDPNIPTSFEEKTGPDGKVYVRPITASRTGETKVSSKNEVLNFVNKKLGENNQYKDGDDITQKTWAFKKPYQSKWREYTFPGTQELFGYEVKVFLSPETFTKMTSGSGKNVSKESQALKVEWKDCKQNAREYFEAFVSDIDVTSSDFIDLNKNIKACKRRFCKPEDNEGKCGKGALESGDFSNIVDYFSGFGKYEGRRSQSRRNPDNTPNPWFLEIVR